MTTTSTIVLVNLAFLSFVIILGLYRVRIRNGKGSKFISHLILGIVMCLVSLCIMKSLNLI